MRPLWYRDAVVYQVDPSLFRDADGDGKGDLQGVAERLDHIRGLGATSLWLLPFYASPFRDGGYDVSDHLAVDPRFGDVADFVEMLERADTLGLHVLVDLVVQHTSDQHRWFQDARSNRRSPFRDYYIWADEPCETGVSQVFPTVEDGVWAWDDEAQQFYRHTFYSHEPDLALDNPKVRTEVHRIMAYWLRLGVSGFRVDAAPFMAERGRAARPDTNGQWLFEELRELVDLRQPGAVLLGEVNVEPQEYGQYFEGGMSMLLDFLVNNNLFLALARQDARPLRDALAAQSPPPAVAQYAQWLRNHDELSLDRLHPDDRADVMAEFAPDDGMEEYGRGIRRRLAPMLGGDTRRLALAHALLLSLPGTPILRYGDEIGMGEDLGRPERLPVRAPMQWTSGHAGGFSDAPLDQLVVRMVPDETYGPKRVNVEDQFLDPDSLLSAVSRLVRARVGLHEIGSGRCTTLDVGIDSVFAARHDGDRQSVVTLVNLADREASVDLGRHGLGDLVDVASNRLYPRPEGGTVAVDGYGYRWLRCRPD